jgi:hypothetical protein
MSAIGEKADMPIVLANVLMTQQISLERHDENAME